MANSDVNFDLKDESRGSSNNNSNKLTVQDGHSVAKSDAVKTDVKKLVKHKSLGRTLSTSVLRIKKKTSFWSSEKFGQ